MKSGPPFDLIIFDCDSTLSSVEGIDELAARRGVGDEVARLTRSAMEGDVPLEDVYLRRLELIRPSADDVNWLGSRYRATMVPGAERVIAALLKLNKQVHVISSGILQAVLILSRSLSIPDACVHAVALEFDDAGGYRRPAETPLARSGGKAEICRIVNPDALRAAAVGDGVSDLEMADTGAFVIGFGGVVMRPAVAARADRYVRESTLEAVLAHLLTDSEQQSVTRAPN